MAIRQYVGARYVPRFTGLYDATQIYDALDVVDNGAGTSYIAKKTVPAGTSLSNTDYWFVYGASSGAIYDLQTRMSNAENDIDKLEVLVGRRFLLIGDSYAMGIGASTSDGWAYQFKAKLGLSDDECVLSIEGSTGFIGNVATRFIDLLNDAYTNMDDPETITDIIVCGGYNDFGKANVGTAVDDFCTRAHEIFPRAIVSIGMCGYSSKASAEKRHELIQTIQDYYVGMDERSRILPNLEYCLRKSKSFMGPDNIHPSALGYLALSKAIISAVLYGDGYEYYNENAFTVGFTDISSVSISNVKERIHRDFVELIMPQNASLITIPAAKPTYNTWYKIGTFSGNNILHGNAASVAELDDYGVSGTCIIRSSDYPGVGFQTTTCRLAILEDELYIKLSGVNPTTGAYWDYSNLSSISLEGIWQFPTLYY